MKFKDVKVGGKIKRGGLVWTKIEATTTGPWKPQNVVYKYPDPRITGISTDHIEDDEEVEVVGA